MVTPIMVATLPTTLATHQAMQATLPGSMLAQRAILTMQQQQ
jgi:hypothetical protein